MWSISSRQYLAYIFIYILPKKYSPMPAETKHVSPLDLLSADNNMHCTAIHAADPLSCETCRCVKRTPFPSAPARRHRQTTRNCSQSTRDSTSRVIRRWKYPLTLGSMDATLLSISPATEPPDSTTSAGLGSRRTVFKCFKPTPNTQRKRSSCSMEASFRISTFFNRRFKGQRRRGWSIFHRLNLCQFTVKGK